MGMAPQARARWAVADAAGARAQQVDREGTRRGGTRRGGTRRGGTRRRLGRLGRAAAAYRGSQESRRRPQVLAGSRGWAKGSTQLQRA